MVLLAGVWLVQAGHADGRAVTFQRLRVQDTVIHLQGCLTCHTVTNTAPESYDHAALEAVSHTDIQLPDSDVTAPSLKTHVNTHLLRMGQRILNVPETADVFYRTVINDFLQIYDQANPVADPVVLTHVLNALEGLEHLLRQVENQAHSEKMDTISARSQRSTLAVMHSTPVAPWCYAVRQAAIELILNAGITTLADDAQVFMPVAFAHVANRRGPPAVNAVESRFVLEKKTAA